MKYISQVTYWYRICLLTKDEGNGFVPQQHWNNKVLIFDALEECWAAEATLGFKGCYQKMFDLLKLPLDADQSSFRYYEAQKLVWRLLTEASSQKVVYGKHLTHDKNSGELWDDPANEGSDCGIGTFAELLRYSAENFVQMREDIGFVEAPLPSQSLDKGLFQAYTLYSLSFSLIRSYLR